MKISRKFPPIITAATLIGCSSCSTRKSHIPAEKTFISQQPGDIDRSAIIDSERRFEHQIVRDKDTPPVPGMPQAMIKAVAYRMSGPYADNVAISLTPDGKSVLSYPAPSDLTEQSAPVNLGNGWWLTRCGITANSAFTTYTYGEYRKLVEAPTPNKLLESVIPGAHVTEIRTLPLTPQQALADTTATARLVRL